MKKIFLLTFLLFQLTFVFGQERGYKKTNWSSYISFPCFPNLQISFRSIGYEPVVKQYEYQFRIKNNSSKNIHFNLDVKINKTNEKLMAGRFDLYAGKEITHETSYATAEPEPNGQNFFNSIVTGYLENEKDDWTLPSYSCNNGVKVCDANCNTKEPNKGNASNSQNSNNTNSSNNSTNQTNNTNQQTTQQNDLSEYNRSKADLERQMNEENARRQQEVDNAYQSYATHFQAGVQAYENNNFTLAQKEFQLALNSARTDEQRRTAKDNYDKSLNAPKRQAIGEVAKVGINALVDILNPSEEERRAERAERKREREAEEEKQKIKDEKEKQTQEKFQNDWITAFTYSKKEDYTNAVKQISKDAYKKYLSAEQNNIIGNWCMKLKDWDCAEYRFRTAQINDHSKIEYEFNETFAHENNIKKLANNEYEQEMVFDKYKKFCEQGYKPACDRYEELNKIFFEKEKAFNDSLNKSFPKENDEIIENGIAPNTILDNYFNAIGGYDKVRKVKTITKLFTDGGLVIVGNGKYYYNSGNGRSKDVFNGKKGYTEYNNKKEPFSKERNLFFKNKNTFEFLDDHNEYKLGKMATLGNDRYYTLITTKTESTYLFETTYYFDKSTGLYKGSKVLTFYPNDKSKKNGRRYTIVSDYHSVDGILFPFEWTIFSYDNYSGFKIYNTNRYANIMLDDFGAEAHFKE